MVKITFFALIVLCVVCVLLFGATTMTNGGVVYKTFATHPDTPPSGGLLMWAKTDGTFQLTNSSGTDSGLGGTSSGGAGPFVSAYNTAAFADIPNDATFHAVAFDSNDIDTSSGAMHTTGSHFIAPTTGYYAGSCGMLMSTGVSFFIKLFANGADVPGSGGGQASGGSFLYSKGSATLHLNAGEYVECMVQMGGGTDHPPNGKTANSGNFQFLKLF